MPIDIMTGQPKITIGDLSFGSREIEDEFLKAPWKEPLRLYLQEQWGDRCPDFFAGCIVCQKWRAFDILTVEGFLDDEIQQVLERLPK